MQIEPNFRKMIGHQIKLQNNKRKLWMGKIKNFFHKKKARQRELFLLPLKQRLQPIHATGIPNGPTA